MFRSILFTPGNEPDKIKKALLSQVDAVALDLEDAVAYEQKDQARQTICQALQQKPSLPVFIRLNAVSSPYFLDDLMATIQLPITGFMLPKTESCDELQKFDWLLGLLEKKSELPVGNHKIIPFIENAKGILQAQAIAAGPRVKCLAFGGVDYSQSLGLPYPQNSKGLFFARNQLVLASHAAGIEPPLDTVFPDLENHNLLQTEARIAKNLGFQGKLIIHPKQIQPVQQLFTPTPEELAYARKIVQAFAKAEALGIAVIQLDGKLIEYPIVHRAKSILAYANET